MSFQLARFKCFGIKVYGGSIPSFPHPRLPQSFNLQLKTATFLIFVNVNITLNKKCLFQPVHYRMLPPDRAHAGQHHSTESHFSRLCTYSLLFHSSWRNINFEFSLLTDGKVLFSSFSAPVYSLSGDLKIMNECHGGTVLFLIYDVFLLPRIKMRSRLSPKL